MRARLIRSDVNTILLTGSESIMVCVLDKEVGRLLFYRPCNGAGRSSRTSWTTLPVSVAVFWGGGYFQSFFLTHIFSSSRLISEPITRNRIVRWRKAWSNDSEDWRTHFVLHYSTPPSQEYEMAACSIGDRVELRRQAKLVAATVISWAVS